MKLLATAIFTGMLVFGTATYAKEEAPKTKKTCIKTTDAKTGKEVEKCKTVTLHEKHEGTKVPEKAPKK
jgi:hypothetical protein